MTEDGLSLNIVRATDKSKKGQGKNKVVPTIDVAKTKTNKTSATTETAAASTKNAKKMTVWKALKGNRGMDSTPNPIVNKGAVKKTSKLFANNPEVPSVPKRSVKPIQAPVFSKKSFQDLNLHPFMVKTLESVMGMEYVTAVQEELIPILISGRDALVRSQTGSGKTLAFAVPVIQSLQEIRPKLSRADGVRALVIAPTRELALQIHEIFSALTKSFTWLVPGIIIGGERRKAEKSRLRKGINVLTCTPGRLLDHIQHTNCLSLDKVQYLVLDEADRMLDLGYEEDVSKIVKTVSESSKAQTVLLSATLSPGVERLAGLSLRDPVRVEVADDDDMPVRKELETHVLPQGLEHNYIITPAKLRLVTLTAFIVDKCLNKGSKMIVFMATQDMVELHAELLTQGVEMFTSGRELTLSKLHGNMAQDERTRVFRHFRDTPGTVLLCTDVAARGLDLPQVDWVVQYNGPACIADYVHRVGRTARCGLPGAAVLMLATNETEFIPRLQTARVRLVEIQMESILDQLIIANSSCQSMQQAATMLQNIFEDIVSEESKIHDLACKAYTSWVRFYASYPRDLRPCFSVRTVHLGHFAKSFALRDPPGAVSRHARTVSDKESKTKEKQSKRTATEKSRPPLRRRRPAISEFDSGLPPIKKRKS